jgi:hypothetical protein
MQTNNDLSSVEEPLLSTPSISQKVQKRRALGDLLNVKQTGIPSTPGIKLCDNNKTSLKADRDRDEDIDRTYSYTFDSFNDILNDSQKLSVDLINVKCVPRLPTGYEVSYLLSKEEKYHMDHVLSDKKFKKLLKSKPVTSFAEIASFSHLISLFSQLGKKEESQKLHCPTEPIPIFNDFSSDYNPTSDLFVPPSDW